MSREWNLTSFLTNETGTLGYVHARSGRIAQGIPLMEHALRAAETRGHGNLLPLFLSYLGEAHVLAGRLEDADEYAKRALTFACERGQRGHQACALRLLGDAAARRDPPRHAEGHYRDALALSEQLGMRPVAAHCHLGLARILRRVGQPDEAREHLVLSTTMYREMGMRAWLEQAEAELGSEASAILPSSGRIITQELANEQPRTPLLRPRENTIWCADHRDAGGSDASIRRVS